MSRSARFIFLATLLAFSVISSGCKTIYSDMYSSKRNRFVPTKEKPTPPAEAPPTETTELPSPGTGVTPPAPAVPDATVPPPDIPGLQ